MNNENPYDLNYLSDLAAGDETFKMDMIRYFFDHARPVLDQMDTLLEGEEWPALREVVHKFGSNLTLIGIHGAIGDSTRLELLVEKHQQISEISGLVKRIRSSVELALDKLAEDFQLEN